MATVNEVLDIVRREIGTKESPANSNKQKYGVWYGWNGVAWCVMFVLYCFSQAGMPLPYKTASCSALLGWYKKNLPSSVVKTPAPGDIIIYNFGHTGIVESVGNGTITAIEGNTSPGTVGSQSNGGMVCRRTRKTSTVTAYIRPDYKKEVQPVNNVPSPAHKDAVEWAVKNGIIKGNQNGDLGLAQNITKQQMCTMLYRFAKLVGKV